MSWVSTRVYYENLNRMVQARSSRVASAPLLIDSLNYADLYAPQSQADWDRAAGILTQSAKRLESAGAGAILICANSMHKVYDEVAQAVEIPTLHIADCVGERMKKSDRHNASLLGTRNVMTENFYRQRLVAHGVDLMPPDMGTVDMVDSIIYRELMLGKVSRDAERALKTIITRKEQAGADAVVLACTELAMVIDVDANVLPIFDATRIHCEAGVDWLLGDG